MKPRLILLDADVIIAAHELGIWDKLICGLEIHIPSIIVKDQAKFFFSREGNRMTINLEEQIEKGLIQELPTEDKELAQLQACFDSSFLQGLHSGEREALAFLLEHKDEGFCFCTGDKAPIMAMAMLGMKGKGISLEKLLDLIGARKKLRFQFSEKYLKDWLVKGALRAIQGSGLNKK